MISCEVLIVGGGAAGIAAAVSAARAGARTLLVERYGYLGGTGSTALVHTLCGLYLLRDEPDAVFAHPGFPSEFARRLLAGGAARGPVRMGRLDVLPHDPTALARVADDLIAETANLQCLLHAELISIAREGDHWRVTAASRGTRLEVRAIAVVDASGDGTLAALAGLPFEQTEPAHMQRPAYIFKLCGMDHTALDESGRLRLAHGIASDVRAGSLPPAALGAAFRAGIHEGECHVTIDLAGDSGDGGTYDPCDAAALTALEQCGRRTATELAAWLATTARGFERAWIAAWPVRAGIRESRRILGQHVLSADKLLSGEACEDSVALATWPVELREKPTGPRWRFPDRAVPGHIPLRSLCALGQDRFFMAGRCISATHEAQASIRVMGTCMATGEAAGIAAALTTTGDGSGSAKMWTGLARRVNARRTELIRPC